MIASQQSPVGLVEALQDHKENLEIRLKEYPDKHIIESVGGTMLKYEYWMLVEEIRIVDNALKLYATPF